MTSTRTSFAAMELTEKLRKLPLSFLETPGLECAVWPELYWHRNLCETVTRANHENRRKRQRAARQQQTGDSTSSSNASSHEPVKADCGEASTDPRMSSRKRRQPLNKCDKFQQALPSPSCQDWCLAQQWNHDGGRTPTTSSLHKYSVKLSQTNLSLLQPEEGWGYSDPFSEPVNWHVQLMQRFPWVSCSVHARRKH